jgi:predicted RNA binding protein YcfA (HicA-like mRNA interferase family)
MAAPIAESPSRSVLILWQDPSSVFDATVLLLQGATLVKVREVVALLRSSGWVQVAQVGSHRQFKNPSRPGRVTLSGNDGDEIPLGTLRSVYRQAGLDWKGRRQ